MLVIGVYPFGLTGIRSSGRYVPAEHDVRCVDIVDLVEDQRLGWDWQPDYTTEKSRQQHEPERETRIRHEPRPTIKRAVRLDGVVTDGDCRWSSGPLCRMRPGFAHLIAASQLEVSRLCLVTQPGSLWR